MAAQYTQQQYNTLCAAIAQGITQVKYGDKEVTYRSLNEMLKLKNLMEAELGIKKNTTRKFISFKKGFN